MKKDSKLPYFMVAFAVIFATFSFYAYQMFFATNILVDKEDRYVYIREGVGFKVLLKELTKDGTVHDGLSFAFISKLMKYQENIKPGRYLFKANSTNLDAIRMLRAGLQSPVKITFTNLRLKSELIDLLSSNLDCQAQELTNKLNDKVYLDSLGFTPDNVIGMFVPNTYEFYWNTNPDKVIKKFHKEYVKFWTPERMEKARNVGLQIPEISVLASIVEAETNQNVEKPTIAGVYLNRLRINMPLQADPTVKFALQDFSIKRINQTLIQQAGESPYNTYRLAGLPPGPINTPSIASIEAVLNFEKHEYLFFVADFEKPGFHKFNKEYNAHVNTANKYRKSLDNRNIH